jgi:bacteriocin-like protein
MTKAKSAKKSKSTPRRPKTDLSEQELKQVSGGFNPFTPKTTNKVVKGSG